MSPTLKAVASFSSTGWQPLRNPRRAPSYPAWDVMERWAEDVGDIGIGFDDLDTGVEWQEVDNATIAYRICGKLLLVVTWDYDAEVVGDSWRGTLTIDSWQMGTDA